METDQFCLKWNNFQTSIVCAFESLQSSEDLADVTLTTDGINVKAHKIILAACSPYFRTIFKENPCPHPIVILKDVLHDDLLAVLNFMYHGEVLVAKDRLQSFLQTAEILQVSGLIGCTDFSIKSTARSIVKHKTKDMDDPHITNKRSKTTSKIKKCLDSSPKKSCSTSKEKISGPRTDTIQEDKFELVCVDKIKTEINEELQLDINDNGFSINTGDKTSILESVLEAKECSSILERSLTSQTNTGKSPTSKYSLEHSKTYQSTSELVKHLTTPKKLFESPETDFSNHSTRTSDQTLSQEVVDLAADHNYIKNEEELIEVSVDVPIIATDVTLSNQHHHMVQEIPHHSSQCGNCPHCGKVYSNQSALKYHVRLVHSDLLNMYCCHLCPEAFEYREAYKRHMVETHSLRN